VALAQPQAASAAVRAEQTLSDLCHSVSGTSAPGSLRSTPSGSRRLPFCWLSGALSALCRRLVLTALGFGGTAPVVTCQPDSECSRLRQYYCQ
jgi:hypothetical protein